MKDICLGMESETPIFAWVICPLSGTYMPPKYMWELVTGEVPSLHENVYTVFNRFGAIHNLNWHYFQNVTGKNLGKGPCLYDLKTDPEQTKNVIRQFPKLAKDLRNKLQNHLKIKIHPLKL